jgi:hypothetical protein
MKGDKNKEKKFGSNCNLSELPNIYELRISVTIVLCSPRFDFEIL